MNKVLIIKKTNYHMVCLINEQEQLLSVKISNQILPTQVGCIYLGKVKNIKKDISAAFIDYGQSTQGFLQLKENKHIFIPQKGFVPLNMLKVNDEVLIQVLKDAFKDKGASLSSEISMSGQNIVVHSESEHCGISQKIVDENIRKKLYKYVRSQINDSFGFVIRTSAVDALKYDLKEECFQLANELTGIITSSKFSVIKSCLYAPHPLLKALYTYRFNEISTIISDDAEIIHTLNLSDQFKNIPLKSYTDSYSLENLYKINTQIQTALSRNVWLKSGANVIFDTCEAATVIDINSKKSEFKLTHNDASLKINLEAAKLIGLQIQLRNISGIILIDFIDVDPMDHQSIIDTLSEALKSDPYKTTIYGFTQLGLLECSRQKKDLPLFQLLKTVEEFK